MPIRVPDYFIKFQCIADKCRESCCIGWEIDIDEITRRKYASLDTPLGSEIREKTSHGCFPLQQNGRCAFLDGNGLCRIISSVGDAYLCDICREHPRYYGVGDGIFEGGLGLGCEEAARMILELCELPRLIEIEREIPYYDEDPFAHLCASVRESLYRQVFTADIDSLAGLYAEYAKIADDAAFDASACGTEPNIPTLSPSPIKSDILADIYGGMVDLLTECEALSDEWEALVSSVKKIKASEALLLLDKHRGLIYYFTHRYVRECVADMSFGQRIIFALGSGLIIAAMSSVLGSDVRAALLYSKNVEYSTDNVDYILDSIEIP